MLGLPTCSMIKITGLMAVMLETGMCIRIHLLNLLMHNGRRESDTEGH